MRLLITGASGFIGGFVVDKALALGHEVVASVRESSSRAYLKDGRIKFVNLNLSNKSALFSQLNEFKNEHGNIDGVIHNAGVTKTLDNSDYEKVNFEYTRNLIEAFEESTHALAKFVFISSLAAAGPGIPNTDENIKISDNNHPVTAYGKSKLMAENYIKKIENFPYVIIRPPAVFGPRDRDVLEIFDMVNKGFEIFVGVKTQHLSIVYVKDLAAGILTAMTSSHIRKVYFVSDGKKYTNLFFSKLVKKSMGKKTIVIKLPIFLVYVMAFFAEGLGKLTKKPSALNVEKMKELKCTNWLCDASSFIKDTGFRPEYSLEQGIAETTEWYKSNNWL